ncbi:Fic family protein [Proteinivorax tanatarense]|uniref:protein adenylyltransferase n=1 Tax=Proteinivorax tanatarense TaxID=1260629 RepID=A0AAU7VN22_9FIRM
MGKISEKHLDYSLQCSRATLEMEELYPSKENDEVCYKIAAGDLNQQQAIDGIVNSMKLDKSQGVEQEVSSYSKYCYEGSLVLINNFNIRSKDKLLKAEGELARIREFALKLAPKPGQFDLPHLQEIHKFLFQDIYPFAGKLRQENISKGNSIFLPVEQFQNGIPYFFQYLNKRIAKPDGLKLDDLAAKLAYYMSELNFIHPFREGNGRTQREFIRCLALKYGYTINWASVGKLKLKEATIKAFDDPNDLLDLAGCIKEGINIYSFL